MAIRDRLPLGIHTFERVRSEGMFYVDKTGYVAKLLARKGHYFLTRPRRFGKTLFLNTVRNVLEGREALFRGLAIHEVRDWSRTCPVLTLDFGLEEYGTEGHLRNALEENLRRTEETYGLLPVGETQGARLRSAIERIHAQTGQEVALLVDEYDKPITDAWAEDEQPLARLHRRALKGLYSGLKSWDNHIQVSLVTGSNSFARSTLFSGGNHLTDLTLDKEYAAVCGYTQQELEETFGGALSALGIDLGELREWYDGYSWDGTTRVYNPYDVLETLRHERFAPWWIETGPSVVVIRTLNEHGSSLLALEGAKASQRKMLALDIDQVEPVGLMFQSGYLTIQRATVEHREHKYVLGYPNREVRRTLNEDMLPAMVPLDAEALNEEGSRILHELITGRYDAFERSIHALFASIPHQWYTHTAMAAREGYYAAVLYACLSGADALAAEESSSRGRSDIVLEHAGQRLVIEMKLAESSRPGDGLDQIKSKGYAERYAGDRMPLRLVEITFSTGTRNLSGMAVEEVIGFGPGKITTRRMYARYREAEDDSADGRSRSSTNGTPSG